jgi:hypothetical protein
MNIRTNNHARPLLGFYDLSEKERTEVGSAYDIVGAQFVRYREWVYAMDDFVGTTAPEFEGWHGVYPESYFSGVYWCDYLMMARPSRWVHIFANNKQLRRTT